MFKTLLISTLIVTSSAHAKEVWFGITGINNSNKKMNYRSFYDESNAFLQACKRNPNRDCRRYINSNTSLADEPGTQIIGENRGAAQANRRTGSGILQEIKSVIANAKRGDRIVISLNNHGGPGWDRAGQDTSCIFLQNRQKICDSDLAKIIGDLPEQKGFQVAIVAEGCFSGGFNSLASKNVCVATTSDQQRAAYGARFWQSVVETNANTLSEAGASYRAGNNPYDHTMLASQYMENVGCGVTQRAMRGEVIRELFSNSPMRFTEPQLCTTNSGYRQLNELTYSMNEIVSRLSDAAVTQRVCRVSTEWCSIIQNITRNQNTFLQTREYASLLAEIQNLKAPIDARAGQFYASVRGSERRNAELFVNYNDMNAFARLSPAAQQIATAYAEYANSRKAEIDRLFSRMSELVRDWQNSPVASDLRRLTACLSTPIKVESNDSLVLELEAQARTRRRLQFTEQDKQDARQCEQSFRL